MYEQQGGNTPVAALAAAAVLFSTLSQPLSSSQLDLCSEIVCWTVLAILLGGLGQPHKGVISKATVLSNHRTSTVPSWTLWMVAAGVAVASLCKAEYNSLGLLPALTPLLLISQRRIQPWFQASTISDPSLFSPIVNTISSTTLAAAFIILSLSDWDPGALILSAFAVAALLIVYVALLPGTSRSTRLPPTIDLDDAITPLSLRVLITLVIASCIQVVAFGFPQTKAAPTIFLSGVAKALSWYFTIRTAEHAPWCIAAAIGTFGIVSTSNPYILSFEVKALSHVAASFLTLGQIIHMLPRQTKAKSTLWIFALVSLVPYIANVVAIRTAQSSIPHSFIHDHEHPVEHLYQNAKADFDSLLLRQSRNYTAAHVEYRRRYGAEPPPGFESWYKYAASHGTPLIDDYDSIYDAISPFWKLSGKQVLKIMSAAQTALDSELWHCKFSGKVGQTDCSHPHRTYDRHVTTMFDRLFGGLSEGLPDVTFLVNHLDEPRVLLPPGTLDAEVSDNGLFNLTNIPHRPVWDAITKFCASQHSNKPSAATAETFNLPFVTDTISAMDLCQHPEYRAMHGLFMGPTSLRLFQGLVPVLSTGSPSVMGDILFPSPAYMEPEFQYAEAHDVEWEKKSNDLYWAGSTTGGFASDHNWRFYHRQRFVELAQNLNRRQHYYLRESKDGVVGRAASSFLNGRLFDVAFTRIFQCERSSCRDQRAYFNAKPWADKDRALRSRLVFDIDGNGISGRYYKLLASRSVPLKQTVLREWHDERLVPWLHYIPVSQSMDELPELVLYLTSTELGQQRAREIAERGRDWFSKAFREVDLSIYTYRLLLELARLQDPERQGKSTET